ncbi:hypothetical protein OG946_35985 [Streptomyces sp. NBC_01808]|uniref:hypothetical protein n=1 Tax=Streptomyces sp. NBC_01808 TaxID=2975947 RepID=UPI002DD9DC3C|nr:hypothetical protein [Streptomyces sp. NBC_01808]WSA35904.1 hypothetical protein OG946_00005 [Streptomyces sp. NBC_01808]WSA42297.1 hypothetical protein OG946_35985 [Streptomyces sp. NBC_01808]
MRSVYEEWGEFGRYNARGIKGGEALAREIERVAQELADHGGIATPPDRPRGRNARLRYLDSPAGRDALARHGISRRLIKSWETSGRQPSARKLQALDDAYREVRRTNVRKYGRKNIVERLNNGGHGTRMEIYTVDQSQVPESRRRDLENLAQDRSLQVRYVWEDAVTGWAEGDDTLLGDVWEDIIADLDSDWAAYSYVGAVTLGA